MDYESLKARHRVGRHDFHANLSIRAHHGQIRECGKFTDKLVPRMIEIALDQVETLWADAFHPVVGR